jgi:hypothetical protein
LTLLIKLANAEQVGMKREEIAACENGSREWGGLLFPEPTGPCRIGTQRRARDPVNRCNAFRKKAFGVLYFGYFGRALIQPATAPYTASDPKATRFPG